MGHFALDPDMTPEDWGAAKELARMQQQEDDESLLHTMTIVGTSILGDIWQCDKCERRIAIDGGRSYPIVIHRGERVPHVSGQEG